MDNHNTSTSYSTANPQEFKMEVISLLNKINNQIEMSTSKTDAYKNLPGKKMAVNIAILKTHEFKLNEALAWLEDMDTAQWIEHKADLIRNFEAAHQAILPTVTK